MARQILYLGTALSTILKNANTNFNELYGSISELQELLVTDAQSAVVYNSVDDLITHLGENTDQTGGDISLVVGDEIYVIDADTPDFWVSGFPANGETYTEPTKSNGAYVWGGPGATYKVGGYLITVSKSREIDLEDYQAIANLVSEIDYDATAADASSTAAPTAKAVQDVIKSVVSVLRSETQSAVSSVHTHTNKAVLDAIEEPYTTAEKTKLGKIDDTLLDVTASDIGKIQSITVNGEEVEVTNQVAAIKLPALASGYSDLISSTNDAWLDMSSKPYNGHTYISALRVASGSTALELLNANKEAVVAQIIVTNTIESDSNSEYIYMCVDTEPFDCYLRQLSGYSTSGTVVEGGSVDTSEIEADIDELQRYTGLKRSIVLPEETVTGRSSQGTTTTFAFAITNIDGIKYKSINGVEIGNDYVTVLEIDATGGEILRNSNTDAWFFGEKITLRIEASWDEENKRTRIYKVVEVVGTITNNYYDVTFPETQLYGILDGSYNPMTLYNHTVVLVNEGYSFENTASNIGYTTFEVIPTIVLNYIDNNPDTTTDIATWVENTNLFGSEESSIYSNTPVASGHAVLKCGENDSYTYDEKFTEIILDRTNTDRKIQVSYSVYVYRNTNGVVRIEHEPYTHYFYVTGGDGEDKPSLTIQDHKVRPIKLI